MPQFRILIAVMVDADALHMASYSGTLCVDAVKRTSAGGPLIRDARVLKIEDVSPPSLDIPADGSVGLRTTGASGTG